MAETKTDEQNDQSMEEILQSIKRIIADDDEAVEEVAAKKEIETPQEEPVPVDQSATAGGSDVLELRDLVEEGSTALTSPTNTDIDADVLSAIDDTLKEDTTDTAVTELSQADVEPEKPNESVLDTIDSLLSTETVKASSDALQELRQQKQVPVDSHNAPSDSLSFRSGATIEDLVVEALKPELKSWLNANLASIVENLVAAEVKKITDS